MQSPCAWDASSSRALTTLGADALLVDYQPSRHHPEFSCRGDRPNLILFPPHLDKTVVGHCLASARQIARLAPRHPGRTGRHAPDSGKSFAAWVGSSIIGRAMRVLHAGTQDIAQPGLGALSARRQNTLGRRLIGWRLPATPRSPKGPSRRVFVHRPYSTMCCASRRLAPEYAN